MTGFLHILSPLIPAHEVVIIIIIYKGGNEGLNPGYKWTFQRPSMKCITVTGTPLHNSATSLRTCFHGSWKLGTGSPTYSKPDGG